MGSLMQSLGLGDVSANVNEIPDGKYDAIVEKSEAFFNKAKDTVSHAITYRIDSTDPAVKGKAKVEYTNLGTEPRDANGEFTDSEATLARYTNTQTTQNKQFHKKRFVDLLASASDKTEREQIEKGIDNGSIGFESLVGAKCVVNIKTNKDGYQNVAGAWKREGASSAPATQAVSLDAVATTPAPAAEASPQPTPSVVPENTGITSLAGGLT